MSSIKEKAQPSAGTENRANVQENEATACKYTTSLPTEYLPIGCSVYVISNNQIVRTLIEGVTIALSAYKPATVHYSVKVQDNNDISVPADEVYSSLSDALKHLECNVVDTTRNRVLTVISPSVSAHTTISSTYYDSVSDTLKSFGTSINRSLEELRKPIIPFIQEQ